MSERSDRIRARLAVLPVSEARAAVGRTLRLLLRKLVYEYAQQNCIVDFADTVLVEDSHRAWRQQRVNQGTTLGVELQAATTMAEVLAVFDQIAPHIE